MLRRLLLDWRRHGVEGVIAHPRAGRLEARVAPRNALRAKPLAFALDVFALVQHAPRGGAGGSAGRPKKRAVLEVSQLEGSRATFDALVRRLQAALRRKGMVMVDKAVAKEMKRAFAKWDGS